MVPAVLILGVITHTYGILVLEAFEIVLLALTLLLSYPRHRPTEMDAIIKILVFA